MSVTTTSDRDLSRHQLSARGEMLLRQPPLPEYLREHFLRETRPYHPESAPDGYIPLCIAENKLVWDLLQPKMAECRGVPHSALCYDAMIGSLVFREQLAAFLSRAFLGRRFTAEQVAVLAGAGAVLELLFYAIAEPGDAVLVPTPSYAGFWMDLETRNQLTIIPVCGSSDDGFRMTTDLLEQAYRQADRPVRALILCSPSNPLGTVFTPEEISQVLDWAERHRLHVVCDEVYALSVFGTRPFASCATLRPTLGERLHIVWAFSKDFGASGLRCGVLITENQGLFEAVEALSDWACCSGDTQYLLAEMISDEVWVMGYIEQMRARLGHAYREVSAALAAESIPFLPAGAGFFLLCDLRPCMAEITWREEDRLWRRLLSEGNINLTPGSACRTGEPGFLRLCFASVPSEVVVEGIRRLGSVLNAGR